MVVEGNQKRMTIVTPKCICFFSDGSRVSFWNDVWCGKKALCLAYPTLFNLVAHKDAKAVEV